MMKPICQREIGFVVYAAPYEKLLTLYII